MLEGIVVEAARLARPLRLTAWRTFKNPEARAVKREAEEEWGKEKWR